MTDEGCIWLLEQVDEDGARPLFSEWYQTYSAARSARDRMNTQSPDAPWKVVRFTPAIGKKPAR